MMPKTCAVIPAAGRGVRMGAAKPKQFLELSGKPILLYTLETLSRAYFLSEIILAVQSDFLDATENLLRDYCSNNSDQFTYAMKEGSASCRTLIAEGAPAHKTSADNLSQGHRKIVRLTAGGIERQDSVFNALQELPSDCDWVLIHDGVRPFVSLELVQATWEAAQKTGAAIAALPASDTIKRVREHHILETLPRDEIWLVQTPQVFRKDIILTAYLEARKQDCCGTDDAFFVERLGLSVAVVLGERSNIKITSPEDLTWGSWFFARGLAG